MLGVSGGRSWLLILFALFPILAHSAAFFITAEGQTIGRIDRGIFVILIAYSALTVLVVYRRRFLGRFLLLTYSTLFAVGAGEILLRSMVPTLRQVGPWPPVIRTATAADTMPGVTGPIRVSVNRLGLRGPDVRLEEARIKILCVGGSTTECLYITDEKSWPWRLQDKLTESLGRPVFVGNAGRSGHFTLHHDYLLRHYAPVAKFDWVVVLCGINDMSTLLRDNYEDRRREVPHETLIGLSPVYYRNLAICRGVSRWWEIRKSDKIENVVEDAGGAWIAEDRQKRRRALQARTISELPPKLDEAIVRYSRDLRRVIAACRQRGVKLVLMTQPTMWTEKMPPELAALLLIHSPDGAYTPGALSRMMERYNQALRDVCSVDKVDCIDLARLLAKDTSVFYDDCHFNVHGCESVATIVTRFLVHKLDGRGG